MAHRWLQLVSVSALVAGLLGATVAARAAAQDAPCGYDTPSVTALSAAMDRLDAALVPTPVVAQLAPYAGDAYTDAEAARQAGCLPALPSSMPSTPPPSPSTTPAAPTSATTAPPATTAPSATAAPPSTPDTGAPATTTPAATPTTARPPTSGATLEAQRTTTATTTPAAPTTTPTASKPADQATCLADEVAFLRSLLDTMSAGSSGNAQQISTATTEVTAATNALNNDLCLPVALPPPPKGDSSTTVSAHQLGAR